MKKRVISLLLTVAMLAAMVPALALPAMAEEAAEAVESSFVKDHRVTVTADPMTYDAFARANSGLDAASATYEEELAAYMASENGKKAFAAYMETQGRVIWSGDWMIGGIDNQSGAFEPIAYHTFFEGASWTSWKNGTWYTTKTAHLAFLQTFLIPQATSLWHRENTPYLSDLSAVNQVCFSAKDKAYASYTYTVPSGKGGTAVLSLLDNGMKVSGTTRFCVMKNDRIVWPAGATIGNAAGWATDFYNNLDAISRLGELSLSVEEGDRLHFVVAGKDGEYVKLNPSVTLKGERAWQPSDSVYENAAALPDGEMMTYEEFCAQPLDPAQAASRQAYLDYVLNETSAITWTGGWSVGESILTDGTYAYDPIAYRLYHGTSDWDAVATTSDRFVTARAMRLFVEKYLSDNDAGTNHLWDAVANTAYGQSWGQAGIRSLLNNKSDVTVLTWAYVVPSGVTQVVPSIASAAMAQSWQYPSNTRLCIMKNGQPVWPQGATNDAATWATKASAGWAGVRPTADELNAAWQGLTISVTEGDRITFCIRDGAADRAYDYRFAVNGVAYDPTAFAEKSAPVAYRAYCENVAQPLDPYDAAARQAYLAYVLNETAAITWTGSWSVGESLLASGSYTYDPIAYRLYHVTSDWDAVATTSERFVTARAMRLFVEKNLADNDSFSGDNLWGTVTGTAYGQSSGQAGIRSLLNNKNDVTVLTWAYVVPSGTTQVAPSITSASMAYSWQYPSNTRLCIMKNGLPVWPQGATTDAATWATKASAGWAGVRPTADELNAAWQGLTIPVAEGDLITFCIRDGAADRAYDYRFAVNGEVYDPTAFTEKAAPIAYRAYCEQGEPVRGLGSSYDQGGYAKDAFAAYYLEQMTLTRPGDWSLGQLHGGSYTPLAGLIAINGKTAAGGYAPKADLVTTEAGMRALLSDYLAGKSVNALSLSGHSLCRLQEDGKHAVLATGSTVAAYRYTLPQDGRIRLSIKEAAAYENGETYLCVMYKGEVIWPSGATTAPVTWATLTGDNLATLNESLAGVTPYAKQGETVDFCIATSSTVANDSALLLPRVEIYSPLASLFELQAAAMLGKNLGATFYATYASRAAANGASAVFAVNGQAVVPQTADTVRADGTVTRAYTLTGLAAKELTEPISYSFACRVGSEEKQAAGSITVAGLLESYLKVESDGRINTADPLSALALATLNYAAAAQQYFSYRTDVPANAAIPAEQRTPTVKVNERELAAMEYRVTEGAALHFTQASVLLNDVLQLKLGVDADSACADHAALSLVVKTAAGKSYTVGSLSPRGDDTGKMKFKCVIDIPMLHYGTSLTFGVYRDGQLVSDELVYGVGCYAARIYGQNDRTDRVLDAMLTLGDAATAYRYLVENAVSATVGVPATPGSTVDLACYPLRVGDQLIPAGQAVWTSASAALVNSVAGGRYVQAPAQAGIYRLVAKYDGKVYAIPLVVCDAAGSYPAAVAEPCPSATVDPSVYGDKAAAATGADVPAYWTWALNTAVLHAKANEERVKDKSKLASFLFLTDTHWEQNNRKTFRVANYLQAELGLESLIFGGDAIDGNASLSVAAATMADWLQAINTFNGTWYAVRGNHDQNASWLPTSLDEVWTDEEYYDHVLQYAGNARADGSKKLYNYVDDPVAKIRYYFLADDSGGYTASGIDTCLKAGVNAVPYAEQVAWLKETAATLEEGWGIVVTEHAMFGSPDQSGNPTANRFYEILIPALNEIDRQNEVIAVFSGHTHWDGHLLTEGGYYVISSTNDGGAPDPSYPLTAGTKDEQRMEIVQIDRESRKLYLTRIGGGYNRTFTY